MIKPSCDCMHAFDLRHWESCYELRDMCNIFYGIIMFTCTCTGSQSHISHIHVHVTNIRIRIEIIRRIALARKATAGC